MKVNWKLIDGVDVCGRGIELGLCVAVECTVVVGGGNERGVVWVGMDDVIPVHPESATSTSKPRKLEILIAVSPLEDPRHQDQNVMFGHK
jgi:hypothetical protein